MRRTQALSIVFISMLLIMLAGPVYCGEIFYFDEELITVEGKVDANSQLRFAQHEKANSRDTVQWRKRREQNSYQAPPENAKSSITIQVVVRAYCLGGFTSRGTPTRVGAVAVDPGVIPFGSKMYIPGYGWGTALDTGGAIRGNSIDIWMPTYSQCMQWGVRTLTIKVVKP
jgi:3D (Asp-Asp-Asp) domain-containing protein